MRPLPAPSHSGAVLGAGAGARAVSACRYNKDMCGRFTLSTRKQEIADQFPLFEVPDLEPRYNIAPTQAVPAARVVASEAKGQVVPLRWIVPSTR